VGVDAFTMRALAEQLDTSTATLYRHVDSKDDLMVHVVDRVLGVISSTVEKDDAASWQQATRARLLELHEALSSRPKLLPLLAAEVPIGPNGLAAREAAITELVAYGFEIELAARVYTTLAHYTVGFAVQQHAPGAPTPAEATELRSYYRKLDAGRFPSTRAAAQALTGVSARDEFVEGLQFILDGIEPRLTRAGTTPA
jgi:AcrR family transcriptional regulator